MNDKTSRRAIGTLSLAAGLTLLCEPALAGNAADLFGGNSPIQKLIDFMTGPLAFMIVIIGIVITGGMLMFGNDLSGFGRRVMLVVLGGGLVLGATQVIGSLFSADTSGASYSLGAPLYRADAAPATSPTQSPE